MSQKSWQTTDMATAAYVKMRGLPLSSIDRSTSNRFVFHFKDEEEKGDQLRLEFVNSDFVTFDHTIKSLKKMCYDRPDEVRRGR